LRKPKIQLREGFTYHNPHVEKDFKVLDIYDRQVVGEAPGTIEKRVRILWLDGTAGQMSADYSMIRDVVQKAMDDKINYEQNLGSVFHSKEFVDTVTLYKMAQNCEIRAVIHPRDRDKLADEIQSMTEAEVDWDFVDECAREATNSNWHISYQVNFPEDDDMWFNPNLNKTSKGNRALIANNEMIKLLFEMGFKLGREHDIKRLAKCCPPLKCMKGE
jgi:hypothetical protein